MLKRERHAPSLARRVAFAAALVLAIVASYELGMAADTPLLRILPLALAVILIVALSSPMVGRSAPRGSAEETGGWERFGLELERSRRHARPLALLRITPRRGDGAPPIDVDEVETSLRAVDAAWRDGRHVYILMPETDRPALMQALSRLTEHLPAMAGADLRLAMFPEDGITSGALITQLETAHAAPRGGDIIQLPSHDADRQREQLG